MEGIDFHDIFLPDVKIVYVCIVLALVFSVDLELRN